MNISKTHTTNASLKYFLITVIIISVMLLSMPAKAESGTLSVTNHTFINNFQMTAAGSAWTPDFTKIAVYTASWDQVETIFIDTSAANVAYATNGKSTTFTITACGSGGGVVSYSGTSKSIAWYFSNPSTITCSPLVLTYDVNIFTDVTASAGNQFERADLGVTAAHPFAIADATNTHWWAGTCNSPLCNTHAAINYNGILDNTLSNVYTITYPGASIFSTFIDKSAETQTTKVIIENATGSPVNYSIQGDPLGTYNTNSWTVINTYGQGIALNMTSSTGDFERVVINTTGSGLVPEAPQNASNPNAANCVGYNCITTSKPTYNNTESVNIYGSFYPATTIVTDCLFFGFICTDKTISTESTTGYVFVSTMGSTSPIKFISFSPDLHNNFNLYTDLDIGTYQAQLFGFAGPGTTCTSGIVYDFPFVPLGCYYPHNITSFNVVNASGNLSIHWQTKISNSTAIYGDTITVAWSNVTPNDTVVIYDNVGAISQSYNINQSTVSQIPVFIPLYTIGTWNATIFNSSDHNHNATAYLNVVPPGSVDVNNSFGITMYWSKAADVINNPTFLNWNTGTYTGNYNISILLNGEVVRTTPYYGVPGQTQQGSYTFGEQGAYVAQFLDYPNQSVQAQADIFISAATSSGGGTGGTTANESSNNLVGAENQIITLPWIGLMVLIVVIFGLWKNSAEPGFAVFVIALTTSIEAVIGLWQNWGIYITVLSWLLVGVFFKLNKSIEV